MEELADELLKPHSMKDIDEQRPYVADMVSLQYVMLFTGVQITDQCNTKMPSSRRSEQRTCILFVAALILQVSKRLRFERHRSLMTVRGQRNFIPAQTGVSVHGQ